MWQLARLAMPRVLLNFQLYEDLWSVHFIEADCKTLIGLRPGTTTSPPLKAYGAFMGRGNPLKRGREFDRSVRAWSRGSNYINLTDEQYAELNQPMRLRPRC